MRIANVIKEARTPNYVFGLLKTTAKKVCTNMAETLGIKHDLLNREVEKLEHNPQKITKSLQKIGLDNLGNYVKYLIFDDSVNNKQYAEYIEGLASIFDSCIKKDVSGLQAIIALVTDTIVKIPIDAEYLISKIFSGKNYKSKSHVAEEILQRIRGIVQFDWIIANAHQAIEYLIGALFNLSIRFLMKIAGNRVVIINGQRSQLQNFLRLKRNSKFAWAKVTIFNKY